MRRIQYNSKREFLKIIGLCIGIVLGVLYGIGGLIVDVLIEFGVIVTEESPGLSLGTLYALLALVIMPVMAYLVFSFLGFLLERCKKK